jgi:hypothetical protein
MPGADSTRTDERGRTIAANRGGGRWRGEREVLQTRSHFVKRQHTVPLYSTYIRALTSQNFCQEREVLQICSHTMRRFFLSLFCFLVGTSASMQPRHARIG